jgi:RNA polymerase sigma-70 factor (sigma-E family)
MADRDADFEDLYRREYEGMSGVAFLLLDSSEAAAEVTHDAFAAVYERWDRIDEPGAYLRRCVINGCRDVQRRRHRERSRVSSSTITYEELGARELLDAIGELPMKQRAAVVLRYYEGLSEAETAAALDIPVGTVKSNVSRALDHLRGAVTR